MSQTLIKKALQQYRAKQPKPTARASWANLMREFAATRIPKTAGVDIVGKALQAYKTKMPKPAAAPSFATMLRQLAAQQMKQPAGRVFNKNKQAFTLRQLESLLIRHGIEPEDAKRMATREVSRDRNLTLPEYYQSSKKRRAVIKPKPAPKGITKMEGLRIYRQFYANQKQMNPQLSRAEIIRAWRQQKQGMEAIPEQRGVLVPYASDVPATKSRINIMKWIQAQQNAAVQQGQKKPTVAQLRQLWKTLTPEQKHIGYGNGEGAGNFYGGSFYGGYPFY